MKNFFRTGDQVLVRDYNDEMWALHIFSHYDGEDHPRVLGGTVFRKTIPYKNNEDLLGTTSTPRFGYVFGNMVKAVDSQGIVRNCVFIRYIENNTKVMVNDSETYIINDLDDFIELNR